MRGDYGQGYAGMAWGPWGDPAVQWWPPGYGPASPYEQLYAAYARQQWAPPELGRERSQREPKRYSGGTRPVKSSGKRGRGSGVKAPISSPGSQQTDPWGNPLPPGGGDPYAPQDPYAQQMQQYQQMMLMQQYQQQLAQMQAMYAQQQQQQQQRYAPAPGSGAEQYYDPSGFLSAPWQGPQGGGQMDDYMAAQAALLNGIVDEDGESAIAALLDPG